MNEKSGRSWAAKKNRLFDGLRTFPNIGIGFSGGVDSTLLLAAAVHVLGDNAVALTAVSPIHPSGEKPLAMALAKRLGVRHLLFDTHELEAPAFLRNDRDRCYHCKLILFSAMRRLAEREHIQILAHGANADDSTDFRPGLQAAREMRVVAPLADAGFGKEEIRRLAREMGLSNWDRPAMACLATRIAYGIPVTVELLARIDHVEAFLRQMGISTCRARHHGELVRIEVDSRELAILLQERVRRRIVAELRRQGYHHIALDLEGYVSGKMNRGIVGEVDGTQ